ncbi:MAG: hypothetical protein EOP84_30470 [Verrucomicrobiaceae bacterium]|nr:MAG: hypothetical protein EOP84_30470 [Verrucomicrobiaceae bacterium]
MKRSALFLVVCLVVAGCDSSEETGADTAADPIVGAWMAEGEPSKPTRVFFYEDGTANIKGISAKWKKSGDRYHSEFSFGGKVHALDVEDTLNGIAMTWPDGRVERLIAAPNRILQDIEKEEKASPQASP